MTKSNGRILSDGTLKLYAEQILECIKMWDVGQVDAFYMVKEMKYQVSRTKLGEWKNPLLGTGLTAPKIIDELAVKQGLAPTVPDNPLSAPLTAQLMKAAEKPN